MKSVVEWRTNMIDVFGYEANLSAIVGVGGIAALTCNSPHCKKKKKFNFFPIYICIKQSSVWSMLNFREIDVQSSKQMFF